jgi:5-methylcytosine-specific restriction endonuclease McrA
LEQALSEAERAHQIEVHENRAAAQKKRQSRSPEEKAAEEAARLFYSSKYSKDIWSNAVDQAARHRTRAVRRGLTDHFTAEDWIKLAEAQGFGCAECKKPHSEEPLQTHHIRALMHDGSNLVSNITLVCATCHLTIAERGEDMREEWYASEMKKVDLFAVGDEVQWRDAYGVRLQMKGKSWRL